MRLALVVTAAALFAGGCSSKPKLVSVSPTTLCANETNMLTLNGSDLHPKTVQLAQSPDMGGGASVTAASVSGSGSTATATFTANTLMPSDTPYDVIVTNSDGSKTTLPAAVTVVPGISIAAVDPATVYNGVDFPTSVYGIGMGAVKTIQIAMAGGAGIDLTNVVAVDPNRADAVVPMGTPPGVYDVTVVDSNGCTATLPGALTVTADLTVSICGIDPTFGYDMEDTDVVVTATADGKAGGMACGGKTTVFASSPRAWLNVGGTLQALSNVAFVSGGSITATVPKGLTDGGPYDLIVQNPDGGVGLLPAAFKVVNMPVPVITSVTPTQIEYTVATPIKILGKNFRSPVKVEVYQPNSTIVAGSTLPPIALTTVPSPTVVSATEVDVTVDIGALGLPQTAGYTLLVRVTDTDQGTYGEFASLSIISSSGKPGSWTDDTAATPLPMATMHAAGAAGQTTLAAHHLYLVGGDGGGATPMPYATTQVASFDKFGNIGSWSTGHNKLAAGRTMLGAIGVDSSTGVGGYIYAIGGYDGTAAVTTVSRAKILLPSEAPSVTKSTVSLGGMLARGTWYYRVSAVLDGTDVANPKGETLPSNEVTAHTVDQSKVTLTWDAVPKAASYRIYRTAMVNGISQTEVLLKDAVTDTTFVDDGTLTSGTDTPFKEGELGVWVDVSALKQPRRFLGVALAHDPTGATFLYAVGGDKETGYDKAVGANAALLYSSYEYAPLTDDGLTLGAWTEDTAHPLGGATAVPRTRLSSAVGDKLSAPTQITGAAAYVYALGGSNSGGVLQDYELSTVQTGGALATWTTSNTFNATFTMQGVSALISSGYLFAMGGTDAAGAVSTQAAASNQYATVPSFGTLSSDPALRVDTAGDTIAAYGSLVPSSSHLFLLGGTTGGTPDTGLTRVWSTPF